jgi:hypothetical protein
VPEAYTFTGQSTLGYMAYADLDTGRMLIAEPGQPYRIRATEEGLPVPPADGRWSAAPPPGPPPDAHPGPGYPVTVLPAHAPQGGEF